MSVYYWLLAFVAVMALVNIVYYASGVRRPPQTNSVLRTHTNQDPYVIYELDGFLTVAECDALIADASTKLEPSRVYTDDADLSDTPYRDSMQAWMRNETHPVVKKINQAVAQMSGHPAEHQEDMQVVKYGKGGFFSPHYDACYGDKEFCQRMNSNGGPRLWTFMIYLNDGYEGGRTTFPKIGRQIKPKKGKLIIFQNTDVEQQEILDESLHGGDPVKEGTKWICNKWVRHRTYNK